MRKVAETLRPKVMPHNLEAEVSILGCMLLDNKTIDTVTQTLTGQDFYSEQNKWVFDCICQLEDMGMPVDTLTLADALKKEQVFDKIGGYTFLAKVGESVLSTANVEYYCDIVKQKAVRRHLIQSLGEVIDKCYLDREKTDDVVEQAQKMIYDISMNKSHSDFISLSGAMENAIMELTEVYKNPMEITGVATGYPDLDNITAGLQKGDFILIAARPSMGKTALAVNIAENVAIREEKVVALFSLEMSAQQLTNRIIASEAEVDSQRIKIGRQTIGEWKKIINTFVDVKNRNARLYLDDTSGISVGELRSKCRKLKATKGLDLIVIDYLQLMTVNSQTESRQQEISAISRELKSIAKEIECPLIALSQLSRAPEARTNKRPMLSDLRESGAIEQDADVVLLLYRDQYYNPDSEDTSTEVIIAKHRNGSTGTVKLTFQGEYTKFVPEIVQVDYE